MTKPNTENKTIENIQQSPISSGSDVGSKLLDKKVISEDQLNIALKERERIGNNRSLGVILVDMGFISEGALGEILNESSGLKKFDLKASIVDSKLVKKMKIGKDCCPSS